MERFAKIINGSIFARRSKEKAKSSVAKMARIEKRKDVLRIEKDKSSLQMASQVFYGP